MIIKREQAKIYLIKGSILRRTYIGKIDHKVYIRYIRIEQPPCEVIFHDVTLDVIKYKEVKPTLNGYEYTSGLERSYFTNELFNGKIELLYYPTQEVFIKPDEFEI